MRLTDTPAYCASCFGQYPERRHVDMEAYFDGPVLDASGTKQAIDDLVLCEDCVREAAQLVLEGDAALLGSKLAQVEKERNELRAYRARMGKKMKALSRLLEEKEEA